ncbi:alpha/beta hydrolase [Cytobacillus sp. IB215665]|uniref:alpha/beta fold hydrolase n=1 Tax=Cytobacillus sp. IB215665 TaxID=3097357 RepID=UPI002A0DB8EC|nr:alpha/beta hydrolase [Cytobacillus sp. IB215665]MDX8365860.1 alpha/beta hydrolase [Cytobacillus sp. IB215665]
MLKAKTPNFIDANKQIIQDSIASLEMIRIGGVEQCILIRGKNKHKPLILFLHGGPGAAQIGYAPKLQQKLEEDFVVVNWDQRGAGKSYSKEVQIDSLNISQFLSDVHELVVLLLQRFNQQKLYLVGHSWGSLLGSIFVKRHPELIHAYIGVGQFVNMVKNEEISYRFTLEKANKTKNNKAKKQLEKIGYPPYNKMTDIVIQRKWLDKFGGAVYGSTQMKSIRKSVSYREYSIIDWLRFMRHNKFSFSNSKLWDELMAMDLVSEVDEMKVPVYICVGRYDYTTPFELAEEYYEHLKAPKKELVWFEKSAHSPNFEEPDKFYEVCMQATK